MAKSKSREPKKVGTWVLACTPQGELIKWGKDGDTVMPYPPDDKDAVDQARHVAADGAHKDDTLYILHVFDNGQMKQFEFDRSEQAIEVDPQPTFPDDAVYNSYDVEALEKFVVRTQYNGVVARSEDEAKWLVRNGKVSYDDKEIEEGDEEFLSFESVELIEEDVQPDEDEFEEGDPEEEVETE